METSRSVSIVLGLECARPRLGHSSYARGHKLTEKLSCVPASQGGNQKGTPPDSTAVTRTSVSGTGTTVIVPLPEPTINAPSWDGSKISISWSSISTVAVHYKVSCSLSLSGTSWSVTTTSTSATWALQTGSAYGQTVTCSVYGQTEDGNGAVVAKSSPSASKSTNIPWPTPSWGVSIVGAGSPNEQPQNRTPTASPWGCPAGTTTWTSIYDSGLGKYSGWVVGGARISMSEAYSTTYKVVADVHCTNAVSTSPNGAGASDTWRTADPPSRHEWFASCQAQHPQDYGYYCYPNGGQVLNAVTANGTSSVKITWQASANSSYYILYWNYWDSIGGGFIEGPKTEYDVPFSHVIGTEQEQSGASLPTFTTTLSGFADAWASGIDARNNLCGGPNMGGATTLVEIQVVGSNGGPIPTYDNVYPMLSC